MKIVTTFGHILRHGEWDAFCNDRKLNPWCINEGLAQSSEEVTLSVAEAKKYNVWNAI